MAKRNQPERGRCSIMFHIAYGIIVAVTLLIFLFTLFVTSGTKDLTKSSKVDDSQPKGIEMSKKNSMTKAEAKVFAANLIVAWVKAELDDEEVMDEIMKEANLTESGERKALEAFDTLLAAVCKKAKVEMKA
jgi:hypothetical protein